MQREVPIVSVPVSTMEQYRLSLIREGNPTAAARRSATLALSAWQKPPSQADRSVLHPVASERLQTLAPNHKEDAVKLLSTILTYFYSSKEAEGRAREIIGHYGSINRTVSAAKKKTSARCILTRQEAAVLRLSTEISSLALKEEFNLGPKLNKFELLSDYVRLKYMGFDREVLSILYLDSRYRLVAEEIHTVGGLAFVPVYPRYIISQAIEHFSCNLVLVHNHLSGDIQPSQEDIAATRELMKVLKPFEITIVDHFIVGPKCIRSMLEDGSIDQAP